MDGVRADLGAHILVRRGLILLFQTNGGLTDGYWRRRSAENRRRRRRRDDSGMFGPCQKNWSAREIWH
jgi:hypothetical protein